VPDEGRAVASDAVRPRPGHPERRRQLLQALRIHATRWVGML